MQVFLPYPEFDKSAQVLDGQRVLKQWVEAQQIYNTLIGKSEGWKNHPAIKMYLGFPNVIMAYGFAIQEECFKRNINITPFFKGYGYVCDVFPSWFYDDRLLKVNSSHKSRLIFKGRVDAAAYSLRKFLKVRSINTWFSENSYPQKNVFTHKDIERLERKCLDLGVTISDNHYRQFGWTEDDTQKYYWPI